MRDGCMKDNKNIYYQCRKKAAKYNEALSSREGAAELLGISASTLANYELDITKFVPLDSIVMMADLYKAPYLKNLHCKNECPIGKERAIATQLRSLEAITVSLVSRLDNDITEDVKRKLVRIAEDGRVSADEREMFQQIVQALDVLALAISELDLLREEMVCRW